MNLRYITCSDLREDVPMHQVIKLLDTSPKVELGIQAHGSAMSFCAPRYQWLNQLLAMSALIDRPFNIAIHVNYDWCSQMASAGANKEMWPQEIQNLFARQDKFGGPLIRRWQLNIGDYTHGVAGVGLARICDAFPDREFIFPYNANNPVTREIEKLNKLAKGNFSLLYDSSYGAGICPATWNPPVYQNRPMGYAGGLSPDNVAANLEKIAAVCPENYTTWIDAEGKLMRPGTRQFDVARALQYVSSALDWEQRNLAARAR